MAEISILLVDDEEFYLRLFTDFLEGRRYRVATARNGRQAMTMLQQEKYDILITDLLMDDIDGLALSEWVRGHLPWMDVIVVTQRDDVRLAVRSMRMGVFEYLVKPIDRDELLLTMDRLLERRRLLDQQNKLLDESMEYLQAQTVYRRCLEILSTLDFDNLCQMILRHLTHATGAQGGILWLTAPEASPESGQEKLNLAGYRGLVSLQDYPSVLVFGHEAGPVLEALRRGTPFLEQPAQLLGPGGERPEREALFVPLRVDELTVGLLMLMDKLKEDFTDRDRNIAATMAQFAAIAIKNSRRFQALERLGLRDHESTAYNLTYFIDYAGKEIYKARRYGRAFSLVVVSLDRFDFLREHFRPEVHRQLSRKLAESLGRVVRDSDILARVSDSEFYVLLPETDALGAMTFARRGRESFLTDSFVHRLSHDVPVRVSMGLASFPGDGKDFDQLLTTCRERIEQARHSLYRRLGLEQRGLWQMVEILVGRHEDYSCPLAEASNDFRLAEDPAGNTAHGRFDEKLLQAILGEVSRQIVATRGQRAIIYDVGGQLGDEARPVERITSAAENTRVFVLGRKGDQARVSEHPAITRVFSDDEQLDNHRLLLVLGERLAYALVARWADDGRLLGLHTADATLVENLIAALQEHYNLQRQY